MDHDGLRDGPHGHLCQSDGRRYPCCRRKAFWRIVYQSVGPPITLVVATPRDATSTELTGKNEECALQSFVISGGVY